VLAARGSLGFHEGADVLHITDSAKLFVSITILLAESEKTSVYLLDPTHQGSLYHVVCHVDEGTDI
jgi:hypothetical protein